jgi:hypothetical protein
MNEATALAVVRSRSWIIQRGPHFQQVFKGSEYSRSMPDEETPPQDPAAEAMVEDLRQLDQVSDLSPSELSLRQMMLVCSTLLQEAEGCPTCVAKLREIALTGLSFDEGEEAVEEGELTCESTRGKYRCGRPPFHIPSDVHAAQDGRFIAYWRDHEHKVTLKLRPSDEVLDLLRTAGTDSATG